MKYFIVYLFGCIFAGSLVACCAWPNVGNQGLLAVPIVSGLASIIVAFVFAIGFSRD